MKINISGKNLEISQYLRDLTEKKLSKLDRYFTPETEAQVTLSMEKNRQICEVTIPFPGGMVRAKEVTGDMYASIDNVVDKLNSQIKRHRTRLEKRLQSGAYVDVEPDENTHAPRRIVRTKRFALKPMSEDEAILQMELLGHSFFVFTNAETDETNVLYLRDDGNLGLIEPSNIDED